jgi:hypothetical protein
VSEQPGPFRPFAGIHGLAASQSDPPSPKKKLDGSWLIVSWAFGIVCLIASAYLAFVALQQTTTPDGTNPLTPAVVALALAAVFFITRSKVLIALLTVGCVLLVVTWIALSAFFALVWKH